MIHILMLNSAVRPDRLACSIQVVSESVLLPPRSHPHTLTPSHPHTHLSCRVSYDTPVELYKFHKMCSKGKTPLVIFHDDPHLPTNQIRALASKLHVR